MSDPIDLLIAMAKDWTDPVVVKDAPERVPHVIEQLIDALTASEAARLQAEREVGELLQAVSARASERDQARAAVEMLDAAYSENAIKLQAANAKALALSDGLRALVERWRDHADKDSDASTEAYDVCLRICADELEALLIEKGPPDGESGGRG